MGYNISETSGGSVGQGGLGLDNWTFTVDLSDPSVSTVTGDFDVVAIGSGNNLGDPAFPGGYEFSAVDAPAFGSLSGNTSDGTFTFTIDRAAVIASGSDQTVSFTVRGFEADGRNETDTVFIDILLCVARGTLVETRTGPVPVEAITEGREVRVASGALRPVTWIGRRVVSAEELARHPELCPIRLRPGALGPGIPKRDLVVSPQHKVLIRDARAEILFGSADVLVPAKALVDGVNVIRESPPDGVEYFHLMLQRHDLLLTEGAATESFYPGPYALRELGDDARADLAARFPGLFAGQSYGPTARPCLKPWEAEMLFDQRPAEAA